MSTEAPLSDQDLEQAFLLEERQVRIDTGKIACILVIVLMPVGVTLDHFVYPGNVRQFLILRLLCSALVGIVWALHYTRFAKRYYWAVGLPIVLLPSFFIAFMMGVAPSKGWPASPYYAGLNLIMLAVSSVGHWSLVESFAAVTSVIFMYLCASALRTTPENFGPHFNNVYFLVLTGVIVVTGNVLFNRLRFQQFKLKQELAQSRQALENTNQKLLELDQVKSRFFANISHELRTPLTLLLAPLETLLNRFTLSSDPESNEMLQTMHSNGMRLLKLINDLLDLVRLESGRMDLKQRPLELEPFLGGLASATRQVAHDKGIRLTTFVDPQIGHILADRDKLEKVLLNLLFNALKFTPKSGEVELRAERQDDSLVLIVRDTGMGIAAKNLPFIFDRFWQADTSSKRKFQGAGIGLALVKELVELHAGKVTVESEEGKGTTFRIRVPFLPVAPASPQALDSGHLPSAPEQAGGIEPEAAPAEEWLINLYRRAELFPAMTAVEESLRPVETWASGKTRRILVADDEPDMLRFLKAQLSKQYQVLEAVDGQQAIEKAFQFLPDLIVLDMMMPEKDGLQACRELREKTSTQNIPVIMLTARADEQTKMDALSAGANDFLTKPFSSTELNVRIANLVETYEVQRKLAKQNHVLEHTIEKLTETEAQLVQNEKLVSLGRWSAGMIHEINNPLNFAATGVFTLRSHAEGIPEANRQDYCDILKDVEEGIKRVQELVISLRMFSHADNESLQLVPVQDALSTALRFLSHEWKDQVEIVSHLAEDQTIWGNKNNLIHLLGNLLQNSLDALREKTFVDGRPTIWIEGEIRDGMSVLIIRDNGQGIAPEDMGKIFDPFFTTKDVGKGMGLGLSICYTIVQGFDGKIHVRSEPGKFCEFTLEFKAEAPSESDTRELEASHAI